jgi:hypothetical protein
LAFHRDTVKIWSTKTWSVKIWSTKIWSVKIWSTKIWSVKTWWDKIWCAQNVVGTKHGRAKIWSVQNVVVQKYGRYKTWSTKIWSVQNVVDQNMVGARRRRPCVAEMCACVGLPFSSATALAMSFHFSYCYSSMGHVGEPLLYTYSESPNDRYKQQRNYS